MRPDKPYIFVSYAHADSQQVLQDLNILKASEVPFWYDDSIRSGSDWQDEIALAIQDSIGVLCFISGHFLDSRHCMNELNFSIGSQKNIFPVYLDMLQLPPGLQLSIGNIQGLVRDPNNLQRYEERLAVDAMQFANRVSNREATPPRAANASDHARNVGWATKFSSNEMAEIESADNAAKVTTLLIEPIRAISKSDEGDFLAEGMTEDLTMFLQRNPDVQVISADREDRSSEELARQHRAQYIFSGSIALRGERLQMRAKLVDCQTQVTVWTEQFMREASDLFEVQGEVIRSLANVVGPAIWHSEGQRTARQDPSDLRAWELVHRAIFEQFNGYSRDTSTRAEALARRAIAIDPDYALGVSTLALILGNRVIQCMAGDQEDAVIAEALALSDQATVLAPRDARILTGSSVVAVAAGDLETALRYSRKSLEHDTSVGAVGFLGLILIMYGEYDEGIELTQREIDRAPDSNRLYLSLGNIGMAYLGKQDYVQAKQYLLDSLALHPHSHMNLINLAVCHQLMGETEDAQRAIRKMQGLEPDITLATLQKHLAWQGEVFMKGLNTLWN